MACYVPQAPNEARTRPAAPRIGGAKAPQPGTNDSAVSESSLTNEEPFLEIDPDDIEFAESVGAGATAEVFRAHWNGQQVAVKEIYVQRKLDPKQELRMQVAFMREVAVMSKVKHPNLVRFFGVSLATRPLRVVTEFCEGDTLFGLLHDEVDVQLAWPQKMKMCRDVCQAMNYLHSFNPQIIHRDLKSLNLLLAKMITTSWAVPLVKVSDFGMARMKDADIGAEWGKMTKDAGTCHWMAPEVPSGKYDEKVDVFSWAMCLFEIIMRQIPFEDIESEDAIECIRAGRRPEAEEIPPGCPQPLLDLMEVCWSQDPRARPSFDAICKVLDTIELAPL